MGDLPNFSIIIPTRDRPELLKRALASVLAQTLESWEAIVVDDGSRCDVCSVVSAADSGRVKYIRRESPGGASAARNSGIAEARGEHISFLDDDDELLPGFLQTTWETMNAAPSDVGLMLPGVEEVRDEGSSCTHMREIVFASPSADPEETRRYVLEGAIGRSGGLTVRRSCLDAAGGFDEEYTVAGDAELVVRLVSRYAMVLDPRVLYRVHRHGGGQLTDVSAQRAGACLAVLRKHRALARRYPGMRRAWMERAARQYFGCSHPVRGLAVLGRLVAGRPHDLRAWEVAGRVGGLGMLGRLSPGVR
jgi:glycosyltransferase involved in cell wall biosynthesis